MSLLLSGDVRMALQSLRSTKFRNFLTMLGIIIGVSSVITAVSLGEGVRHQVAGNIKAAGGNIITIRPGKLVNRDKSGKIISVNYLAAIGANSLTQQDVESLNEINGINAIVPLSTVSALPTGQDGRTFETTVIGTTYQFPDLLKQKPAYGNFFGELQSDRNVVIVSKTVAEKLFKQDVPLGQVMDLRGRDFIVTGVFDDFSNTILSAGGNLNNSIFIPYSVARTISSNTANVYQILVQLSPSSDASAVAQEITSKLAGNHGGQQDFTVLKQDETLTLAGKSLDAATAFIAGIAAISLIVGGIGIMNIMFVGVTERTREIGVRKSLGATNQQIYSQFLIEATIVSLVGGVIGVVVALLSNVLLRIFTGLQPVTTLPIIGLSVLAACATGIIFGTAPAIKAARKDPIESLRYE